jgi:hypothetical protein
MAGRKVDVLRDLQEVDSQLDQIRARGQRIAEAWGNRTPLQATKQAREAAQATLRRAQADQRDLDLQLDKLRRKIQEDSDKLYGGRVKNPRELQDLQAEVEQDKRLISTLEDRSLAQMDVVEGAQRTADTAEAAFARAEDDWKRDQLAMRDEHATLKARGAELVARRNALAAQADAAALRTYEALRRSKDGLAVAKISQRSCQACRVGVTTSEEQKARTSSELVLCGSCGRILYAG